MSKHKPGLSYDIRRGNSTPAEDALADAAPDLLAACEEAEAELQGWWKTRGVGGTYIVLTNLRAAIAKARGEQ